MMSRRGSFLIAFSAVVTTILLGAVAAPATILTAPSGTTYTGTLKATTEGSLTLHGVEEVTCKTGSFEATVEQHGKTATVKAGLSSLAFSECDHHVSVVTKGRLELHSSGTVTSSGLLITVQFTTPLGSVHCVYGGFDLHFGTLTAAAGNSGHAVHDLDSAELPLAGGDESCSENAELTGKYKLTSPTGLLAEDAPSGSTPTSPSGTTYTGEIQATAGTTELHGEAFSFSCKTSQIKGSIQQHGTGVTTKGSLSTFDFAECSFPMTVVANGTIEFHSLGNGNSTVTSTGFKLTMHGPFGVNCTYETSNTDIGTLTGSNTTGSTAKLDINSSLLPRTGDSAFCGQFAEWTGSYTFSTPDYLDFDK